MNDEFSPGDIVVLRQRDRACSGTFHIGPNGFTCVRVKAARGKTAIQPNCTIHDYGCFWITISQPTMRRGARSVERGNAS